MCRSYYGFESQKIGFQWSLPTNISMINNWERKQKNKEYKEEVFKKADLKHNQNQQKTLPDSSTIF